jgi:DNA-binding transcriptional regulator YiaG
MNTNQEFNQLRKEFGIGVTEASRMMDASYDTVKCWAATEDSKTFRKMPSYALKLFKIMIERRGEES